VGENTLHIQREIGHSVGVSGARYRRAADDHVGVADSFDFFETVLFAELVESGKDAVQTPDEHVRRNASGEPGEIHKIAEQDGHLGEAVGDDFLALLESLGNGLGLDIQEQAFGGILLDLQALHEGRFLIAEPFLGQGGFDPRHEEGGIEGLEGIGGSLAAGDGDFADAVHSPDRAADRALAYVEQGFTAVKLDPVGQENIAAEQLSLDTLRNAENVVKKVREAVGDRADILVGTHGQMTTSSAIRLAKRLEPYDPLWFEEPVPPENREELARVARSTSIPIATGERLSTKYEFGELLEKQAASILQMALGRVGGILEAKKIAGMAETHYAQIAPHLWTSPIEGAANIQIDTCSPNFLIQESIETWGGFHAEILLEPIRWEKGYIIPPTGPGLGIELNEEVAAKHPYIG
jgi:hypothetical protein